MWGWLLSSPAPEKERTHTVNAWSASSWRNKRSAGALRRAAVTAAGIAACLVLLCLLAPHRAAAKQEKEAQKPVTCATCHAGVAGSYAHAPMRHAMEPADANPVLQVHPNLSTQLNGYSYSVQTKDGRS